MAEGDTYKPDGTEGAPAKEGEDAFLAELRRRRQRWTRMGGPGRAWVLGAASLPQLSRVTSGILVAITVPTSQGGRKSCRSSGVLQAQDRTWRLQSAHKFY